MRSGDFVEEIQAIQAMPSPSIPHPSGIIDGAAVLSEYLGWRNGAIARTEKERLYGGMHLGGSKTGDS